MKDVPPWVNIGSGSPTTGASPIVIDILTPYTRKIKRHPRCKYLNK